MSPRECIALAGAGAGKSAVIIADPQRVPPRENSARDQRLQNSSIGQGLASQVEVEG